MSLDALFLSPHPDDAELFCGGTIAACVDAGYRVGIVDLTRGEKASNGSVEGRREESLRAASVLGVDSDRGVIGLPDGALDADDPRQAVKLARAFRRLRPRVVFRPGSVDRHPDHVAAHHLAALAATLAATENFVAPESVHSIALLWDYPCHADIGSGTYVDISGTVERWRSAVDCYVSQFQRGPDNVATPINDPGYVDGQDRRRAAWGAQAGVSFAEVFRGPLTGLLTPRQLLGVADDHERQG